MRQDGELAKHPEIADAYEIYLLCRKQEWVKYDTKQGNETVTHMKLYTTGLIQLPREGGVLDQPNRLMAFFDSFLEADRKVFTL